LLHQRVKAALQRGDYRDIVQAADAEPGTVRGDPILRYNAAVAAAATDDRARGIRELELLRAERPELPLAWIALACLYLDEGQPEWALDLARGVAPKLKSNDAGPHSLAALALRRLGRQPEAAEAAMQALRLAPEDGGVLALAAELALDRNELDEADRLLAKAEALAPGHICVRMAKVERALVAGPEAGVAQAINAAQAYLRQHPLIFLNRELERLAARAEQTLPQAERTMSGRDEHANGAALEDAEELAHSDVS
jgi:Flp pilus assembly protein TadD